MRFFYLYLMVFLESCGTVPKVLYIPSEFAPYVTKFESFWGNKIDNLVVKFGETRYIKRSVIIGTCKKLTGQPPTVIIHASSWYSLHDLEKEQLMFHELGHCVLNRSHEQNDSIMVPILIPYYEYYNNYENLIQELFEGY